MADTINPKTNFVPPDSLIGIQPRDILYPRIEESVNYIPEITQPLVANTVITSSNRKLLVIRV